MSGEYNEALSKLQNDVLERIAYGEPVAHVADHLCRGVEALVPETVCSVLLIRDGRLSPLAGPSLPDHFVASVDGIEIGPSVGSCGTAAYRKQPVEVLDIATDPLWAGFSHLALDIGLKACWSTPIFARDGRVIGTFAFYYREARAPTDIERIFVATCSHLCAIAIERHEIEAENRRLALFDTLTGLPNRASFNRRIGELVGRPAPGFGLLVIDLDHLKSVNDTLGHGAGDGLIRHVADSIAPCSGYRLGGDEFAVLVEDCTSTEELETVGANLCREIGQSFLHGGQSIHPSVTIGGVLHGRDGIDAQTLVQNADFALYHGKETGRGGYVAFTEHLRTTITRRINLVRKLHEALADGRILAHYQPIVRLDTAEIVGLEALARLQTRDGRILSAGEFHSALADERAAYALTDRMLSVVARDVRGWIDRGIPFQHVGVNVTTGDFRKGDLDRRITSIFGWAGVPLKHLILEVNEQVLMGQGPADDIVAREVESLRRKGLLVALDDFGTGYASLTHLRHFPVDVIKIDKSFVDRLLDDAPSMAIVEALVTLAGRLGSKIVAEGVETLDQAARLVEMGCFLGQGFAYARPASASVTSELLVSFAQRSGVERAEVPVLPFRQANA